MTAEEVKALSALVQRRFISSAEFGAAARLALYAGTGGEVLTDVVLSEALTEGKEVFYPRLVSRAGNEGLGPDPGPGPGPAPDKEGSGNEGEAQGQRQAQRPRIAFFRVKVPGDLSPGSYGIPEPRPEPGGQTEAGIETFDCIVVPGVAFDLTGARLGRGKGHYDSALSVITGTRPSVVALAFDAQVILVDELPVEEHDVRVSVIVTESRTIKAGEVEAGR